MRQGDGVVKQITLLFHDVIDGEDHRESGFPDPAARRYKLSRPEFNRHLDAIAAVMQCSTIAVDQLDRHHGQQTPLMLSFDDGGVSSLTIIAAELERRGWMGHFFITTDYIGKPGFLSANQIRQLRSMGHLIGSHSCSHPHPMSSCDWDSLIREWSGSVERLKGILEEPVATASIPGGAYSKVVARAAAEAGIRQLFTSEPVRRTWQINDCQLLGRYCITADDPPRKSGAVACESPSALAMEYLIWNGKQVTKRAAGKQLGRLRGWLSPSEH